MTRLRILIAALLFSVASFGAFGEVVDRDILLSSDGTLYTVESVFPEALEIDTTSNKILSLSVHTGEKTEMIAVPATLYGGIHSNPALAYDAESKSLFVFWQKTPMPQLTSDLLFASYQNGTWSEPTLVNKAGFEIRKNLRLATTRFYFEKGPDGALVRKPGLMLHLVWWAETGYGENAGYAMLRLENGQVRSMQSVDLLEMLGKNRDTTVVAPVDVDFNRELFRHPTIGDNAAHDAVDITFADWTTNRFQIISIKPISSQGVLDPPIGVWGGSFGPPRAFHRGIEAGSPITVIPGSDRSKLLFHFRNDGNVEFLSVDTKTSTWSEVRSIDVTDRVSAEAVVEALRRLIASE